MRTIGVFPPGECALGLESSTRSVHPTVLFPVPSHLPFSPPSFPPCVSSCTAAWQENNKIFDVTSGNIELEVNKVNVEEGEVGGVFVSTQFSDTDMGSKAPKKLLMKGIFYGRLAQ